MKTILTKIDNAIKKLSAFNDGNINGISDLIGQLQKLLTSPSTAEEELMTNSMKQLAILKESKVVLELSLDTTVHDLLFALELASHTSFASSSSSAAATPVVNIPKLITIALKLNRFGTDAGENNDFIIAKEIDGIVADIRKLPISATNTQNQIITDCITRLTRLSREIARRTDVVKTINLASEATDIFNDFTSTPFITLTNSLKISELKKALGETVATLDATARIELLNNLDNLGHLLKIINVATVLNLVEKLPILTAFLDHALVAEDLVTKEEIPLKNLLMLGETSLFIFTGLLEHYFEFIQATTDPQKQTSISNSIKSYLSKPNLRALSILFRLPSEVRSLIQKDSSLEVLLAQLASTPSDAALEALKNRLYAEQKEIAVAIVKAKKPALIHPSSPLSSARPSTTATDLFSSSSTDLVSLLGLK